MDIKKYQILINAGLVRKEFVDHADTDLTRSIDLFANYCSGIGDGHRSIGELFIKEGVLTPQLIENKIIAGRRYIFEAWGVTLRSKITPGLEQLVKSGSLGTAVAMHLLNDGMRPLLEQAIVERMLAAITPGSSNIINFGITDTFEPEAAFWTVLKRQTHRDEFLHEQHRLLRALRTTQCITQKREQVEKVVSADDGRPLLEQLDKVWEYYSQQSELFREIGSEDLVPEFVRTRNAKAVNARQARFKKIKALPAAHKRYIDIYGRYNAGEMDPLMLAIITRTVGWYVEQGHARLFTDVRLVPDRHSRVEKGTECVNWAANAFYPKASIHNVKGAAFRGSLLGANRIFLTQAQSKDATNQGSIPVIGLAVWVNETKLKKDQPYTLFRADFDKGEYWRSASREWNGENCCASIAGCINETLRALREVEELEIARANGFTLSLGEDHQWVPSPRKSLLDFTGTIGKSLNRLLPKPHV